MNILQNVIYSSMTADELMNAGVESINHLKNGIFFTLIWFGIIFLLTYFVLFSGKKSKRNKK